jgi:hypothetical protein
MLLALVLLFTSLARWYNSFLARVLLRGLLPDAIIIEPTLELREADACHGAIFQIERSPKGWALMDRKEQKAAHLFETGSIHAFGTAFAVLSRQFILSC